MSRKRKKAGVCCICGQHAQLSREHVPPQAAFNSDTVIQYSWEDQFFKKKVKGTKVQGGAGEFTLCKSCNNNTGGWYATEYVKWARTCHHMIETGRLSSFQSSTVTLPDVYPLRFLKQVITCFLSVVADPEVNLSPPRYPELSAFILDKESQELPPGYRFFINLFWYSSPLTPLRRFAPIVGKLRVAWNDQGQFRVLGGPFIFGEQTHPPFQLIMTEGEDYPDATEITGFVNYGYHQKVTDLRLDLRIVKTQSPYPGAEY